VPVPQGEGYTSIGIPNKSSINVWSPGRYYKCPKIQPDPNDIKLIWKIKMGLNKYVGVLLMSL
jgi:hypothetical protein